jgi:putative membrane protein
MKLKTYTLLAMTAVFLATAPGFSQVQISQDGRPERIFNPRDGLNEQDAHFLREAMVINMVEIQTAQLAIEKSTDPFVTEYAKEMSQEHQFSLEEVKQAAANKNVDLPQGLPADVEHMVMHLANQSGDTFNQAFINFQSAGHQMASGEFKMEIENGKDEDVKAYAVKTLPSVMFHYRMLLNKETMMGPTKMSHGD